MRCELSLQCRPEAFSRNCFPNMHRSCAGVKKKRWRLILSPSRETELVLEQCRPRRMHDQLPDSTATTRAVCVLLVVAARKFQPSKVLLHISSFDLFCSPYAFAWIPVTNRCLQEFFWRRILCEVAENSDWTVGYSLPNAVSPAFNPQHGRLGIGVTQSSKLLPWRPRRSLSTHIGTKARNQSGTRISSGRVRTKLGVIRDGTTHEWSVWQFRKIPPTQPSVLQTSQREENRERSLPCRNTGFTKQSSRA